jgi:hypothetical protein
MGAVVVSQIIFHRIAGTRLYRTTGEESNVKLLLYIPAGAPEPPEGPLTLEATWSEPLRVVGYYLFPNRLPASDKYAEFEASLVAVLPKDPPTHTSFAWVKVSLESKVTAASPLLVAALLPGPVVAEEFMLGLFPPLDNLIITRGTPIAAGTGGEGFIDRFVAEYPAQQPRPGEPPAQNPNGIGIGIPMSGDGLGCLRFEGLYNAMGATSAVDSAVKDLYKVSIDPVDLFDDTRTYMLLTGMRFLLARNAAGTFSIQLL